MSTSNAQPAPADAPARDRLTPVPLVLQWCMHLLVAGLLALAVTRVWAAAGPSRVAVTAVAAALGLVYAVGPALPVIRRSALAAGCWLVVLIGCWLALLALTPDGVWLAFPLFFLVLHLLPRPAGLTALVAITAAAIAGFAWHQGGFTAGFAIGPILGAAVALATVWGYQVIQSESDRRAALIGQLRAAQAELAVAERAAGVASERERLAREIHDTLAQGLSSIQLLLQAAAREVHASDQTGSAASYIEQARQTAQDNLAEARRFVRELAPPDLAGRSLPAALQRLCDTTRRRAGLEIGFQLEGGPVDLPTPVEVALLRIAQSAVANICAHAHAQRAGVTLTVMDTAVALDVVDDGDGFDPGGALSPDAGSTGGFGLPAMRSRVAELGGTMTVESAPGQGTALAVTFDMAGYGVRA